MLQAGCIYLGLNNPCPGDLSPPVQKPSIPNICKRLITPCPTKNDISTKEDPKYPAWLTFPLSLPQTSLYLFIYFFQGTSTIVFFFFNCSFFVCVCSGFCHTLKWNSHGFTCVPHPNPPSHLLLHPLPLGLPSAPGLSACLMHPTWAGDLFHPR